MVTVVPGQGVPGANVNVNGVWRSVSSANVNINGQWRKVTAGYVNINGQWRRLNFGSSAYTFAFNNTLYQGTNGYVSFDNANTTYLIASTVGRVLGVLPADLIQNSIRYAASQTDYYIYWTGQRFSGGTAGEIALEIRFTIGQKYALICLEKFPSSTYGSTAFYVDGSNTGYSTVTASRTQGQKWRVYMDTTTAVSDTFFPWGGNGNLWLTGPTSFNGTYDDSYTVMNTTGGSSPSAPLSVTVGAISSSVTVTWTAPSDPGQSAIQNYDWALSSDGGLTYGAWTNTTTATPSAVITNLTSGVTYQVRVRANNFFFTGTNYGYSPTFKYDKPGTFQFTASEGSIVPTTPFLLTTQGPDADTVNGNRVLMEWASSIPADTSYYITSQWGSGTITPSSTEASPASTTNVSTLNQYLNGADDYYTVANTGTIYTKVVAYKTSGRRVRVDWTNSTGANSFAIQYTISGATATGNALLGQNGQGTEYVYNASGAQTWYKSMPYNGTLFINQVLAYPTTDASGTVFTYGSLQLGGNQQWTPVDQTSTSNISATTVTRRIYPSVSLNAPTSITANSGTINWVSTNQYAYSISGSFSVPYTIGTVTSRNFTGLSPGTTYTYTVTIYSSDGHAAAASSSGTTNLVTQTALTAPNIGSVTGSPGALSVSFSVTTATGPAYQVFWYPSNRADIQTVTTYDASGLGSPISVTNLVSPTGGSTYYFWVRSVATTTTIGTGPTASISSWNGPATWVAPIVTYTVTYNANGGTVSPTSVSVTSGNSVTLPTPTLSGFNFNGWYTAATGGSFVGGAGALYTPTSTITLYAQWASPFTTPTAPAPALQFERTSTILRWYCDYPSTSGSVSSITGMQFEIRTTAGGGTLLASGTRAYPGAFTYPYSGGGSVWAFAMGTVQGDIAYSTSARYGRARVVMLGTNGTTYYGTWSGWL